TPAHRVRVPDRSCSVTVGGSNDDYVTRVRERGSAMLVTMILMSVILSGAAVMVSMQMSSTRNAGMTRAKMSAVYCAEAGLVTARTAVAANYAGWNDALAAGTEPSWLASLNHDLDGDGSADFRLTLRDNNDDTPDDQTRDNDLTV